MKRIIQENILRHNDWGRSLDVNEIMDTLTATHNNLPSSSLSHSRCRGRIYIGMCLAGEDYSLMIDRSIGIDETLKAVCAAISDAETTMREQIKLYYHGADEEFITFAFYSHIRQRLREASRNKFIEKAFLRDLKNALRRQGLSGPGGEWALERQLSREASGLVADMILHNKRQEGNTGGDFGLIVIRPRLIVKDDYIEIKKGSSSGLLCQAKLKRKDGRWGDLRRQREVLPEHLGYASLVLYSYLDEFRNDLKPMEWKLCKGMSMSDIEEALKIDVLGKTLSTTGVITRLGRSEFGTNDQSKIDTIISPSARQFFELRIYWPKDGDGPKGPVRIRVRRKQAVR